MRRAAIGFVLAGLLATSAIADPTDLSGGVLIAHHPPGIQYTTSEDDWCGRYFDDFAIDSCEAQNNRIDLDGNEEEVSVWYVLVAWDEDKEWCTAEFGLGDYNAGLYPLIKSGPCYPDEGMAIESGNWPGPETGIALAVPSGSKWTGNFVPIYYFAGYAYDEEVIPLAPNPHSDIGGTGNCATPPQIFEAEAFGAMGLFTDGVYACPGEQGGERNGAGSDVAVCCIGEDCQLTTAEDCGDMSGEFRSEETACDPNPCGSQPDGGTLAPTTPTSAVCLREDGTYTVEGSTDALADMLRRTGLRQAFVEVCFSPSPCELRFFDHLGVPRGSIPTYVPDTGIHRPSVLQLPGPEPRFVLHADTKHGMSTVDSWGNIKSTLAGGPRISHNGVACTDDGNRVVCLQEFDEGRIRLQRGYLSKSFIASPDDLNHLSFIPFFGGLAYGAYEGFWILSHRASDVQHAKSRRFGRMVLAHLDPEGNPINETLVSDQGRPRSLLVRNDTAHMIFWETEGDEVSGPNAGPPFTHGACFAEPAKLWYAYHDGSHVSRHPFPEIGSDLEIHEAANQDIVLLRGLTVTPVVDGVPQWDDEWDFRRHHPHLKAIPDYPKSSQGHWQISFLSANSGWFVWSGGPDARQRSPGDPIVMVPEVWFVSRDWVQRADTAWPGEVSLREARLQPIACKYALVSIQHATEHSLVLSISDYGLVGLEVDIARQEDIR